MADDASGYQGSLLEQDASLLRRILATDSAVEALDLYIQQADRQQRPHALSAADAELLLERSLEAGNAELAMSLYQQMCLAKRAQVRSSFTNQSFWPAATLQHTDTLVMGLCQQLRVSDALTTVSSIRSQGMQGAEEVGAHALAVKRGGSIVAAGMGLLAMLWLYVAIMSSWHGSVA